MGDDASGPWTEVEWERIIRRSEARSARVMELMETLDAAGADADQIQQRLCREMGWDKLDAGEGEADYAYGEATWFDPAVAGAQSDWDERSVTEGETPPGYDLAYAVGLEGMRTLQAVADEHAQAGEQVHERIRSAMEHALIPAAKLRGGHAMGYDDEVLCANIVYCRIALKAALAAREDVQWLTDRGVMASSTGKHLVERLGEVASTIESRVAELRQRVWW